MIRFTHNMTVQLIVLQVLIAVKIRITMMLPTPNSWVSLRNYAVNLTEVNLKCIGVLE